MCWSASVSLASLAIGTVCNVAASVHVGHSTFSRLCIFFQYCLLMQAAEFFIWSDQGCGGVNRVATRAALVLNFTQPLVASAALCAINERRACVVRAVVLIYVCYTYWMLSRASWYRCTLPRGAGPHLSLSWWQSIDGQVYMAALGACFSLLRPARFMVAMQVYMLASYGLSHLIYRQSSPSLWCWSVVVFPLYGVVAWRSSHASGSALK